MQEGITDSNHRPFRLQTLLVCLCFANGCAIHYFDTDTATEHIWGIGHMQMKAAAARDDVRAVISGVDMLGVSAGREREGLSVALGWERERHVDVVGRDAELTLEWPTSSFGDLRIGSKFPYTALTPGDARSGNEGRQ